GIIELKTTFHSADFACDCVFNHARAPIHGWQRSGTRIPPPPEAKPGQLERNGGNKKLLKSCHLLPFLLTQVVTRSTRRSVMGGRMRLPATMSALPSLFRSPQATVIKPIGVVSIDHILKF